ncbi:MAG: hypothetical protein ABSG82_09055 [Sedimentisphaerales bacterium]|jgi:ABC-type transport system involved in multi-copper enzyme maturation permease subunit
MFTLIKREIEDNRVFFIGALILAAIFGVLLFYQQFYDEKYESVITGFGTMISIPLALAFCAMGAAQMYGDKTKKVSALLATLAVNRGQIFTARVIAGILLVLIGFVPIAGTIIMAVSRAAVPFPPAHRGLYYEVLIPAMLLGFACYCIGLQFGWTSNRITPSLGTLGFGLILIPVILIKGFGWEVYAILVFLIAACLIRAWYKFATAAF